MRSEIVSLVCLDPNDAYFSLSSGANDCIRASSLRGAACGRIRRPQQIYVLNDRNAR
jgi:ribosomal protein L36